MILTSKHIAKSFGRKTVLKDVSFTLNAGTITGIVGENGSGKSVLLQIIVGLRNADRGTVLRNSKMGYCPQSALLFPYLTVEEHFEYFSAAYGLESSRTKKRAEELLQHFNYTKYRREKITHLSGGTRQKLNLSLALLHEPGLLILDEPYNGFDWDTYQKFWSYTDHLKEQGCAVLIVTHLLSEKERFDRIYELKDGVLT